MTVQSVSVSAETAALLRAGQTVIPISEGATRDFIDGEWVGVGSGAPDPVWVALNQPCPTCGDTDEPGLIYDEWNGSGPCLDCATFTACPSPRSCPPMTRAMCRHGGWHPSEQGDGRLWFTITTPCLTCEERLVQVEASIQHIIPVELNQFAERDHDHIAIDRDGQPFLWQTPNRITPLKGTFAPGGFAAVLNTRQELS